jgi:lipoate---protein ligase
MSRGHWNRAGANLNLGYCPIEFSSMIAIDTEFPTPEQNLAFDEALIEVADHRSVDEGSAETGREILRLWEMPSVCVVMGRSSKYEQEVNGIACEKHNVPILRRASGGASVVAGPGCLMYSLLISYEKRPAWRMLDIAHSEVMHRIREAVQRTMHALSIPGIVQLDGTCDLSLHRQKISGNAMRCKRHWMLYHGTILYAIDLTWISKFLLDPPRKPTYRENRDHESFVTKLLDPGSNVSPTSFRELLSQNVKSVWDAECDQRPIAFLNAVATEQERLITVKYADPKWHRML